MIQVDSKDQLETAFSTLIENNILSAPVFDQASSKYLGFLDVRDLVAFAVFAAKENATAQSLADIVLHGKKMHSKTQDAITVSCKPTDTFSCHLFTIFPQGFPPFGSVFVSHSSPFPRSVDLCRRNPFKPVTGDATLMEVCKILSTGTHRVPVVDGEGNVTNIISQSSVISYLLNNSNNDANLLKSVSELHLGTAPVLTVVDSDSAFSAFTKLDSSARSGLGVVDHSGALIANTSGSDIKLFLLHHESLKQPIIEFLNKIRRLDLNTRAPIFTCKQEDTALKVIAKLSATKAHRIFIVDDDDKPVRVVSLTDVIRLVLKE